MVRRALMGVGNPLAFAVPYRRPVVALDVRRGVMPAVRDVLLIVDTAIRRFFKTLPARSYDDERSSCELETRGAYRTLVR